MPHLAPLSWGISLIFFWILLVGVCSLVWWMKGVEVKVDSDKCSSKDSEEVVKMEVWSW
uniref:ATP synthase F0 subunit 8 n=1 Tax=Owenia fusiformis TaxID=6347 RepID=A0A0S2N0F3_OWEFU|nr:ATP synthase F0 subunit 8 [Owenia fusiformis]ALO81689.1 ATP synthase F0 subunit 8 [Owenia fusiformis]